MPKTELNRRLFTRNYFDLKIKYRNLQKSVTEIFKVKIG